MLWTLKTAWIVRKHIIESFVWSSGELLPANTKSTTQETTKSWHSPRSAWPTLSYLRPSIAAQSIEPPSQKFNEANNATFPSNSQVQLICTTNTLNSQQNFKYKFFNLRLAENKKETMHVLEQDINHESGYRHHHFPPLNSLISFIDKLLKFQVHTAQNKFYW